MKVILKEDVLNLGQQGDVVEVKAGYARNYLMPQNLAILFTKKQIKSIEEAKKLEDRKLEMQKDKLLSIIKDIEKLNLSIQMKSEEGEKLFGSVTKVDIVKLLQENNIEIDCLPGPTAFVPALINSGIPCDKFVFEGFLPIKKGRKTRLEKLSYEDRTMVFYESPHKILRTLKDFKTVFGNERKISISRELTKIFQENIRGSVLEVLELISEKPPKGELVIIVEGYKKSKWIGF